jgi:hypothetical protein
VGFATVQPGVTQSSSAPQHFIRPYDASPHYPTMEDVLSTHFDRIEKALSTLVDSIAAYNPSPQAAIDLVAADDELSHGLDQRASGQVS